MRREDLDALVLGGLQQRLMDPALCALFCAEYTRHRNRLHAERNAQRKTARNALVKTERKLDRLVQALMDGVPASRAKEKMAELEARKAALEAQLADGEDESVLIHPKMADYYREQVMQLRQALSDEDHRAEAAALIRRLIDRIVLTPALHEGRKTLSIDLHGQLAGILSMATKAKKPLGESGFAAESVKLVAGAGFEPATFRL